MQPNKDPLSASRMEGDESGAKDVSARSDSKRPFGPVLSRVLEYGRI